MGRRSNLAILIEWVLFFVAVFIAMVAVGTFALPFAVILFMIGAPVFLAQLGGIVLSGGFCWLLLRFVF